ncbi:MAG TPA: AraC family transcriptional regulator, partial [Candidatus Polarisedimenticolaceae bacterium]|nr:AraC family transcriptional regulator [Candidatus Polarisedimenticolaceae bacterium]
TVVAAGPGSPGLRELLAFYDVGSDHGRDALDAEERAMQIFAAVLPTKRRSSEPKRPATARLHRRVVDRACEYLIEYSSGSISLREVARHAGASPAHLSRLFKRHKGLSMGDYLLRLRLSAVVDALERRPHGLDRIARDAGFCSHSHLTTVFRRELGRTPNQVRRLFGG